MFFDNLDDGASNLNVYVGDDEKIHFTDWTGADTALNFSSGGGDYRITISIYVVMAKSGSISSNNTQIWKYEIHDGVLTKISGSSAGVSFSVESRGSMSASAYISSINIEAI